MGTRSLTVMHDSREGNQEIAVLYRQMDGYLSGHGQELKDFLSGFTVVNGITLGVDEHTTVNGGYCLAAQIVAYFKDGVGAFYLYPPGTRELDEEYVYFIYPSVGEPIRLKVEAYGEVVFDGNVSDFDCFLED